MNAEQGQRALSATPVGTSKRVKIAVVANVGNRNLGDEAILRSTMEALGSRLPDAIVRIYTINPNETAERHLAETAPLRSRTTASPTFQTVYKEHSLRAAVRRVPIVAPMLRVAARIIRAVGRAAREPMFIIRSWHGLRGTDLMIIAGSNQLEDWFGGPWGYPYTILMWTTLARLVGAPVAFVSVGAGPLDSRLSRWMCVRALRLASFASFRDAESLSLMRRLGYRGEGSIRPDLVFGLALEDPPPPAREPSRIAVNVFPYKDPQYDPHATDGGAGFAAYVDGIAGVVATASRRGFQPVLFGMQSADERVLDLVQEQLRARAVDAGEVERQRPTTVPDVIALIDGCDAVIATRYHAILLGVLRGRPTVGICYQSKSRRVLEMAGLMDYAVEPEDVRSGAILDRLTATLPGVAFEQIDARSRALRAQCNEGFSEAIDRCLPGSSGSKRRTSRKDTDPRS